MTLPRQEVVAGLPEELGRFEELIRSLDARAWTAPSRCEGWSVADVAAHVTGLLADVVNGRLEGIGTPEHTEREVDERRGRSPAEVADELHQVAESVAQMAAALDDDAWAGPAPGGLPFTLGVGVESLWYDGYLHGEDIRAAAGTPAQSGPGLRAAVSHVAEMLSQREWGPATLTLDGFEPFPVSGGGDWKITGDALQFVLAATGRADPASVGLDTTVNIYA